MSTMKSGSNIANKKTGRVGRILLALLAVLVIGGGAAWYLGQKDAQANAAAQAGSTTRSVTVERGDIRLTASGSGTLVTNQAVNMSFSTSGKVAELNVKLGDMVKTGDVLARLEKAEDLEANLASAQANLLEAQQALTKLQKGAGASLAKAYQAMIKAQGNYDDALSESQRVEDARCNVEVRNKYQAVLKQATEKLHALLELDPSSQATIIAGYDYDTALANYTYCAAYTPTEKTSAQSTLAVAKAALQEAQNTYETLKEAAGVDPDALSMQETRVDNGSDASGHGARSAGWDYAQGPDRWQDHNAGSLRRCDCRHQHVSDDFGRQPSYGNHQPGRNRYGQTGGGEPGGGHVYRAARQVLYR